MAKCLFQRKAGFDLCKQAQCLANHAAGCCAVCFGKDQCLAICPWVKDLLDKESEKKARRK